MKVSIGSDHGGFKLKEYLKDYMGKKGVNYKDSGTYLNSSCDYPDFAAGVTCSIKSQGFDKGVLICTTGIGMSMVANKFTGIRAALCHNVDSAKYSRLHNDANVLVLGAKYVKKGLAKKILKVFLETDFEGGRHQRRVDKMSSIEKIL